MGVVLKYTNAENIQEKVEYQEDIVEIDLSNRRMIHIDLSPLKDCSMLQKLNLSNELLNTLDLTPLGKCNALRELDLRGNELSTIDLTPLSSCHNLQRIYISGQLIREIDLSPLASCRIVDCGFPILPRDLDITPIILNPSLQTVLGASQSSHFKSWIPDPYVRELKIPTFANGPMGYFEDYSLRHLGLWVKPPAPQGSWALLHRIAMIPHEFSIPVQTYILKEIGLGAYGLIDSDLSEILRSIPFEKTIDEAREIIRPHLVERVCKQIDKGGTTIGLNVEAIELSGEIHSRLKDVATLRTKEIEKAAIKRTGKKIGRQHYNIQSLALTAYGFSIIMSIRHRETHLKEEFFRIISDSFEQFGIELNVIEDEPIAEYSIPNMSPQMRNYVIDLTSPPFY